MPRRELWALGSKPIPSAGLGNGGVGGKDWAFWRINGSLQPF